MSEIISMQTAAAKRADNTEIPALQISNLHCSYEGVEILTGLDLSLAQNEILCLLGPSGCGKTTTLKLVAGLLTPSQGNIEVSGKLVDSDKFNLAPEQRNVGMIFQDYALFPHLTVTDNVLFGIRKLAKTEQAKTVSYVLDLVNLTDFADRFPHQLSGGQQQRVAIARALASSPALLLLDEPFSNIDSQVRHHLIEEMRELLKSHNMSAIFVTHSKEEAFAFADRLAVFNQGRIEQIGTPTELYNRPASRFVAGFLGLVNYIDATVIDSLHVKTELGLVASTKAIEHAVGSRLQLAVRPQNLTLQVSEQGLGIITQQQFLGMNCQCTVQITGQDTPLTILVPQPMDINQQVSISIIPHELVLFTD